LEARIFAYTDEEWIEARDRNPFEIVDHLIAYVLGQRAVRRMRAGNDQERVTVRLAARHGLGGKAAGDAGLGLDDDRLAEPLRHLVPQESRDDVHVPARREAMQELDRAIGVLLRRRRAGEHGQQCERANDFPDHATLSSEMPPPERSCEAAGHSRWRR
jgi:hypothetical protein